MNSRPPVSRCGDAGSAVAVAMVEIGHMWVRVHERLMGVRVRVTSRIGDIGVMAMVAVVVRVFVVV